MLSVNSYGQGIWTWVSGSSTPSTAAGVYGVQGVPATSNTPPQCYSPFCWTDNEGMFWLYGGNASYADMWRYDPCTLEWTWIKGNGNINVVPHYGVQGIPSPLNTPGARRFTGASWVDQEGDLWLYGGSLALGGSGGDMWRYRIATNEWTWMAGPNTTGIQIHPIYGTLGLSSDTTSPGSREEVGNAWLDNDGNFWLFGGQGTNYFSDMWMYNPSINQWIWQSGASTAAYDSPAYGASGTYGPDVTPGSGFPSSIWTDSAGHLWLFGIEGTNLYNDLWEYDPSLKQWAWMNGSQMPNDAGAGGSACEGSESYRPGARYETRSVWNDCHGNFWLYGGRYGNNYFGDFWVYLKNQNKWARISANNETPDYGMMGMPSFTNHPGSTAGAAHWKDKHCNFWMWGGYTGLATSAMWRYTPNLSCLGYDNCECSIPVASFLPLSTETCADTCMLFNNLSQNGDSYEWFFPGGNPGYSIDPNPSNICYDTAGIYDVTLIVKSCPYSDTAINPIVIHALPDPIVVQENDTLFAINTLSASTFQWFYNNAMINGATNAFYIPTQSGTYTVDETSAEGCRGTGDAQISVDVQSVTNGQAFILYPNPADVSVTVVLSSHQPVQLKLYNTLGQLVYANAVVKQRTVDLSKISAGVYYLSVQTNNDMRTERLIVTHR